MAKKQMAKKPVSEARNGGAEEADFNKTAGDMKALLDGQSKVRVLVPLESGEKLGEFLPVNINGYRLNVPKGVYVDVPQTVADIISESFNIYEQNSASELRADRNDEVSSALNS
jgi:hypothetical protein